MPIQILPPQLANQIAAGEVVERPASVVKELLENSLDAGATKIELNIEAGGSRLIRIRDNGKGIVKDELALALSRHATSKVSTLDDLEAIASLGFRGEALASISSVSRLTLTSRPAEQSEAWQAMAEGLDMQVEIKPAAHPQGTTIEVEDLFFNTPARRRFLRTDKTEFSHIEEVVRRIALSRFDVQIKLTHNGKIHKHYRIGQDDTGRLKRVAAVCGQNFVEHALTMDATYDLVHITGWLGEPQIARQQRDIQYCYVNGRMMRDKLINHAIRQAYESRISSDQHAAYVLFITLDPKQVDVNVHPAKHEVRFHQARLIHDFIYQAVHSALNDELLEQAITEAKPAFVNTEPSHTAEHSYKSSDELYVGQQGPSQFSVEMDKLASIDAQARNQPESALSSTRSSSRINANYRYDAKPSASSSLQQVDIYQSLLTRPNVSDEVSPNESVSNLDKTELTTEQCKVLTLMPTGHILAVLGQCLYALPADKLIQPVLLAKLHFISQHDDAVAQPLLLPVAIKSDDELLSAWQQASHWLAQLQITIQRPRADTLVIQKVPPLLRDVNLAKILPTWLLAIATGTDITPAFVLNALTEQLLAEVVLNNDVQLQTWLKDYQQLSEQSLAQLFQQQGYTVNYQ